MSDAAKVTVKIKHSGANGLDALRKRLVATYTSVNVGFPAGHYELDGTPIATVAAVNEFGSPERNIPERPFLVPVIRDNSPTYAKLNAKNLKAISHGDMNVDQALGQLGELAVGHVKINIVSGTFTPLKPATIKRKGSSKPLIDTGSMRQAVAWEIEK